jgi:hypothetical protein
MSDDVSVPQGGTYRIPRRRGMDPATRRLAIIASGLGGTLLLVVGLWSVRGHHAPSVVPTIQADPRPLRVKPENAGGMQIAGQNEEILSGDAGPQEGKLAPPAEAPAPQALRAPPEPQRPAVAAAPIPAPPAPPQAAVQPAPAPAPVPPQAAEKRTAPTTVTTGKGAQVQLGALETEDGARAEWQRLAHKMPELLAGHSPAVLKAERDGHALWRLRTGGFADIAQATAFCERVRAKGAGCTIASF